jgi:hypothetical protein
VDLLVVVLQSIKYQVDEQAIGQALLSIPMLH